MNFKLLLNFAYIKNHGKIKYRSCKTNRHVDTENLCQRSKIQFQLSEKLSALFKMSWVFGPITEEAWSLHLETFGDFLSIISHHDNSTYQESGGSFKMTRILVSVSIKSF